MARLVSNNYRLKPKRPGVHSKTKNSTSKKSRNYVKAYRGQGR